MAILDKVKVDFQVLDTRDPRYLSVADYSSWGHLEGKTTIIEIIPPGEEDPWTHYFNQNQVNVFHSVNLGINCIDDCGEADLIDLPDGIYTITVKGSPDSFNMTRKYLKTDLLRLELDKLYINLDLIGNNKDIDVINIITDITMLLEAAAANVRYDNIAEAQSLFFAAQDLLEKNKNCEGCADVQA